MPNINKNIIMQAGASVANATNKAAGLTAATPEPGAIISVIQLVNGGRAIGPAALAHFTESVRNKLLSLLVSMEPIQSGSGTPSPDNVRPISGRTGLTIYVSPTPNASDATVHNVDWTTQAGMVYGGTVDVVTGVLTVDWAMVDLGTLTWNKSSSGTGRFAASIPMSIAPPYKYESGTEMRCSAYAFDGFGNSDIGYYGASGTIRYYYRAYGSAAQEIYVVDESKDSLTPAQYKTAMSGVQLVYELATPVTYQLTGTDIVTLVGDNYIWSDSGDVTITE